MNKRNSFILGLLFVILVVEIIVLAPKEVEVPVESAGLQDDHDDLNDASASGQLMRDVHLVEAKAASKEWELWADRALRPHKNGTWTIEQVRVKFFANNGVTYVVTGRQGHVIPEENDIRIRGDVVTRSSNGYVFRTESAVYDAKQRRLTSPHSVQMLGPKDKDGPGIILTGSEMSADLATNQIVVNHQVRARKQVKEGRVAMIQSQKAIFSGRTKQANFLGDVLMELDTMQIAGPEAHFAYDTDADSLESVVMNGGVRLTDTDRFATSDTVSVHFKEDRVVFHGAPRVVQSGDEIVGDEIVFLQGGKKVKVSNAKAQIDPRNVETSN